MFGILRRQPMLTRHMHTEGMGWSASLLHHSYKHVLVLCTVVLHAMLQIPVDQRSCQRVTGNVIHNYHGLLFWHAARQGLYADYIFRRNNYRVDIIPDA